MASNSFQIREFEASLEEYTTQLQQVDSALSQAPDNEELIKLKSDLEQLIGITQILGGQGSEGNVQSSESDKQTSGAKAPLTKGDRCLAIWPQDGKYYPGVIVDLTSGDGKCTVKFEYYNVTERVDIAQLRPNHNPPGSFKKRFEKSAMNNDRKRKRPDEKEYKKNKALKKEQKFKERDEASAKEIRKWQDFRSKTSKNKMISAKQKSSIFSVPDAIEGKVGVGTCNIGGKPMTAFEYPKTHKY
ncbi:Survival of motor neuron-related-splicing factor 30-like [Oopsacas minuta]|uniref:Survival of motor neuron-related-splicing factor 30-like n=1 Tax=Oopsacas minuta TaxID=111878 RepID=A0AAV7KFW5_9METZ|nr:Survival of motor neuron-related-splicing factor 30-like [Oopsacas minuta]